MSKNRIAANFGKAAFRYDESAALQQNVGEHLWSQMGAFFEPVPQLEKLKLLDLGSGSGYFSKKIMQETGGDLISLDIAHGMLQHAKQQNLSQHKRTQRSPIFINADAENIPLKNASVDVVFSNFVLQWCDDLGNALEECLRILKPGGCLGLSIPITGTLTELRQSWQEIDNKDHINTFYSAEQSKAILSTVLDKNHIDAALFKTQVSSYHCANYYNTLKELLKDLKHIGANTVKGTRSSGLMGKTRFSKLEKNYEQFRVEQGLPASYEVLNMIVKMPSDALLNKQVSKK